MVKPKSVLIIGWIVIIFSSILVVSNSMNLIAYFRLGMLPSLEVGDSVLKLTTASSYDVGVFLVLKTVEIMIAGYLIFIVFHFMNLRFWAKTILEIILWIGVFRSIGYEAFRIFRIFILGANMAQNIGGSPIVFYLIATFLTVFKMCLILIPLLIILKFLRGERIKSIFEQKIASV